MSRRMIAMTVGAAVVVIAAIALAVLTRPSAEPLKQTEDRPITPLAARSTSTSEPPRDSIAENSVGDPSVPDVAGLGNNGSDGDQLRRLDDELAQHHWANAVAQCFNPTVAMLGAKACTISACGIHDARRARTYYANVAPADRVEVEAACTDAHVSLDRHRMFGPHHMPIRSPLRGSGG
jgi:hypothetical protein